MIGQRLRIQTEGLAHQETSALFIMLRVILSVLSFAVAISGLVGIVVFSVVHWTSFS